MLKFKSLLILSLIFFINFNKPINGNALQIYKDIYEKNNLNKLEPHKTPLIPLKIHQIWIGPNPLPEKFKWMTESWKKFHPNWEYKLWTNEDVKEFKLENQEEFDIVNNWGGKSDILRYEILNRYGGVYVDTDFECIKPLDILNHTYEFYSCLCELPDKNAIENGLMSYCDVINNALIGSCPGHPILTKCIKEIKGNAKIKENGLRYLDDVWQTVGPGLISKSVLEYVSNNKEQNRIIILSPFYFYPFPASSSLRFWNNTLSKKEVSSFFKPETYAVHYWATSWH